MSASNRQSPSGKRFIQLTDTLMAICLGVMALAVFLNVVLRYGFGSGIAASEEISRLSGWCLLAQPPPIPQANTWPSPAWWGH